MFSISVTPTPIPLHNHHPLHRRQKLFHWKRPLNFFVQSSTSLQEEIKEKSSPDDYMESGELLKSRKGGLVEFLPPIKAAKRVVLVRHGQSTWNAEGRIQGSSNFSILTQKGEAQAETSRQMLIDDSFDVCFSRWVQFLAVSFFTFILFYFSQFLLVTFPGCLSGNCDFYVTGISK